MKHILLCAMTLGLLCNPTLGQNCSITIPAGARGYVPLNAQLCADTINVYGTLECANVQSICGSATVHCYGTCIPPELSGDQPIISVTPQALEFGSITSGSSIDKRILVSNSGNDVLVLSNQVVTGLGFALLIPASSSIGSNMSAEATIQFNPATSGQFQGEFTIESNDPSKSSVIVSLSGTSTGSQGPRVSVDNNVLDFGVIEEGQSRESTVTISNIGDEDLAISRQTISGRDSIDFAFVDQLPSVISPGANATARLRAYGIRLGLKVASYILHTNDPGAKIYNITLLTDIIVDVEPLPGIPVGISLYQNYPNPFNPATEIVYEIDRTATVRLDVYDAYGKLVRALVDERQGAGVYKAVFNAATLASGVYAALLRVRDTETQHVRTIMMTLMK
jgi:HYDIN/CFA65/VesB family protein